MSDLRPESIEAFDRLLTEQTSYIREVDQQLAKWTQFQTDYQQLNTRLSTLPDRLTYDCMVPFGKLAFIPGRIVHSNELLVLLGENYFVERSCKQAMEIVNRRLENINENLRKHQTEKDIFAQQKKYTNDFLDDQTKFIEIKEDDEERPVASRRAKLTDEQIREERRRLQERALKLSQEQQQPPPPKRVHFDDEQMETDSDEEMPIERLQKISVRHTPVAAQPQPMDDASSALFSHPGAIGQSAPIAFTGKTVERVVTDPVEAPKRISKFKASRT